MSDRLATRRDGLIEAEVDGELLGLHIDKGFCYGFNPTATRIWALIDTPRTLPEICAMLVEEFEVEPGDCMADTAEFVDELLRLELVALS